jgi:glucosamine--fructose-6-phosphate aminotransferase (isomerizing)
MPLPEVVRKVLLQVQGAFGVCFLFADQPDILIGARKGSPLILGIGRAEDAPSAVEESKDAVSEKSIVTECFMASDASAIIEYTNKVA